MKRQMRAALKVRGDQPVGSLAGGGRPVERILGLFGENPDVELKRRIARRCRIGRGRGALLLRRERRLAMLRWIV